MSKIYQYVEIVATSSDTYQEAISLGIADCKQKFKNLRWFEVLEQRGFIGDDGVAWYQVTLKIGYCDE